MSDTTADKQSADETKKGGILVALAPVALLLMLPIAPATFTVVATYMAPSLLLALFRKLHMPGAIATVAGLNFAGTMPALQHLWTHGNDFDLAFQLVFNMEFVLINLFATVLGVSLLWISPFIARTWVDIAGHRLLVKAQAERKKLIEEWGEELAEPEETESKKGDGKG